jgi:hypothetical protein
VALQKQGDFSMKTHRVYLFKQVFSDGREMIARWSPTISRKHIKPFHPKDDPQAIDYLEYYGYPVIDQFGDPRLIPSMHFEIVGVDDDAGN